MKKKTFIFLWLSLFFSYNLAVNAQEMYTPSPATLSPTALASPAANDVQEKVQRLQQLLTMMQQKKNGPTQEPTTTTAPSPPNELNQKVAVTPREDQADLYEQAFTGVIDQLFPMAPKQITHLKEVFHEAQRSAAVNPGIPPRPTSTSVLVDLAPQATPPIIRLQAGYITSLVFMDSTGQPWPIFAYSLGDPTAFNIQWDKKGNTLLVQSVTFYKQSNLAVILKGLNTPVMLTLLPGQEAVDYRVDLRVPGLGPNASFTQQGLPESTNPILIDVLNGIPPPKSKTLLASYSNCQDCTGCQAWLANKTLYLRTKLTIVSPAWKSIVTSMDGTHAYELQPTPVILASENGKNETITLTLEGFE